jgi:DNA-binding IclR family transcriptional regulator
LASALSKALSVSWLLRRHGPLALTDIAKGLEIAPSTAHSVLRDLVVQGAVVQDRDRRYRLGPLTFYLGAGYSRSAPIYRAIWSPLVEAARELSLIAVVAVPWENHHLMLAVHQNGNPDIEVASGGRVPIDAGSFGKAYYAWSGATVGKLSAYTSKSITDEKQYVAELARTTEHGYATDNEEVTIGVGAVTSGVTSEQGFEGVASLLGPISLVTDIGFERAGRILSALAARASFALGDPGRIRVVGEERPGEGVSRPSSLAVGRR